MNNKTCIVIVGPTAVGKTSLAIQLAKHFNTEIISADSRQCYKELNIGVAKPFPHDLSAIKHYFINSHSIHQEVNAKTFEEYAVDSIHKIFSANDVAIIVGGTGLYVNAFCDGIDEMPAISDDIKKFILVNYEKSGIAWLQNEIKNHDELYFSGGEIRNPQRLMRALEVKLETGKSITEFQTHQKKKRDFKIIKIGLELTKDQLHKNINDRIEKMIQGGLLQEAESLLPHRYLKALQTVGYKELFDYLDNQISLKEATEKIKTSTRQYAKRQMTWFKKDEEIKWIKAMPADSALASCLQINCCGKGFII